jgi:hypothetical protein
MNENELNNMLSDFFSKANLAPGKSTDTLVPKDATRMINPFKPVEVIVIAAGAVSSECVCFC